MLKIERKVSKKRLEKGEWKQVRPLCHNLLLFKKDPKLIVWDSNTHKIEGRCRSEKKYIIKER